LSLRPPLADVTEDFVCFLVDGDMSEELITGLEFSATEHAKQQLRAKGLLPTEMSSLPTFEDWFQEGQVEPTTDVETRALSTEALDPLKGLEVAVSTTIDATHLAAVFAVEGELCGAAPLPGAQEPVVIGRTAELNSDPYVLAGSLPRGAVRAQVRAGRGEWHEATAAPGAWICVLGAPGRGDVAVRYVNVVGDVVPLPELDFSAGVPNESEAIDRVWEHAERVLGGVRVPLLWPRQISGPPELFEWDGDIDAATAVGLAGGGCRLWIGGAPPDAREIFKEHLIRDWNYEARTAAPRANEIVITDLPGSIANTPASFKLAAPAESWMFDEGWVATISVAGFTAAITGFNRPPKRLDFAPFSYSEG
jgi:hypothetical protein